MGSTSPRGYVKWKNHIGHCLHQLHYLHPSPCIPHHAPLLFTSTPHHLHPSPCTSTPHYLHPSPPPPSPPPSSPCTSTPRPPSLIPPLLTSDTRDFLSHVTLWRLNFLCSCLCVGAQWKADGSIAESFRTFQQAIQCVPT